MTTTRTKRVTPRFLHRFTLKGIDRQLPPGNNEIVSEEELIEELSFPVYRRVASLTFVPGEAYRKSPIEMVNVDPQGLAAAHERDQTMATPQ
jgi:hypothetical protein